MPIVTLCGILLAAATASPVIQEDFSRGMPNWWTEGGERTWVEDGRLHMRADNPALVGGGVATAWCRIPHPADFRLELDAHVVSSSIDANNINLFFSYRDPSGKPLEETKAERSSAAYDLYHKLTGYIVTFLNARNEAPPGPGGLPKARIRIRRNPGFNLLSETFAFRCRQGETYHLAVTKRGGEIRFAVNGSELLRAADPQPLGQGLLGLRTYRTYLWWDNIQVFELK